MLGNSMAAMKLVIRSLAAQRFFKEKHGSLMACRGSAALSDVEICAIFADPIRTSKTVR